MEHQALTGKYQQRQAMAAPWYNRFVSHEDTGKGNLPEVAGSCVILVSLLLPWVIVQYRLTSEPVAGAQLFLHLLYGREYYSLPLTISVLYLAVTGFYTLLSAGASRAAVLGAGGVLLTGISAFLLPIPLLKPGIGIYTAGVGAILLVVGFFTRR